MNGALLLVAFLPRDRRDDLLGDLEEGYQEQAAAHGVASARYWYICQIVKSFPPILGRVALLRLSGLLTWVGGSILAEPPMEIARQWMGRMFFLFATGWIVCVFGFTHSPAIDPIEQGLPAIELPNSAAIGVYFHSGRHGVATVRLGPAPECACRNALGRDENDLLLAAFLPPLAIILASLGWIAFSDRRQVARALRTALFTD